MSSPSHSQNMKIAANEIAPHLNRCAADASVQVNHLSGQRAFRAAAREVSEMVKAGIIAFANLAKKNGEWVIDCVACISIHAARRIQLRFARPTLKDSTITKPRGEMHWPVRHDKARAGCGGHSSALAGMAAGTFVSAVSDSEYGGQRKIVGV